MSVANGSKSWALGAALVGVLTGTATAQPANQNVEIAVNGPAGALLLMDGQAMGRLPLPVNLVAAAGPHRFQLELGSQKGESPTLTLPADRQAELNLTLSGRTLIAVLRITPGLLLLLTPATLPAPLRSLLSESITAVAKQEHSTLIGGDKYAALLRLQSVISGCVDGSDCHESPLREGQVAYVLSVQIEPDATAATSYQIRAALLDVRTSAISAHAEDSCGSCDPTALAAQVGRMAASLLQDTATRPRGSVAITSTPAAAKVLIDGRWLGRTPFQREAFAGPHSVELQRDGYLPYHDTIQVGSGLEAVVQAPLVPAPRAQLSRPLWRIVTGSVLIGGGLVLAGFGTSALLSNRQCLDVSNQPDTCSPYYDTTGVGGALVGSGAALTIAGTILLAVPRSAAK